MSWANKKETIEQKINSSVGQSHRANDIEGVYSLKIFFMNSMKGNFR